VPTRVVEAVERAPPLSRARKGVKG
jgi:hypothetical protein